MTIWRWDQGRLEYFMFDHLRAIAKCLSALDGKNIGKEGAGFDPLRQILQAETGLPFLPTHYTVWRNYARVFGCSLLATKTGNWLLASGICNSLADNAIKEADDYLALLIQRFRYPSPAFESYNPSESVVFPFLSILKLLAARAENASFPSIELEDVFSMLIGNTCTGLEDPHFYHRLKPTSVQPEGDQKRQVREMLLVLSQFSFLKWTSKRLFLDTTFDLNEFLKRLAPLPFPPARDRIEEFVQLTTIDERALPLFPSQRFELPADLLFTEGKRARVTHLKIERSPLLRKMFFEKHPLVQCNMCELKPKIKYPWTDNILEIHHLLPLSSGIAVSTTGTSLEDIVSLCPNCHRSVHVFYKIWLDRQQITDFSSKSEAKQVYEEVKRKIIT